MSKAWPQLAGLGDADDLQLIRWLGALKRNPAADGQLHLEAIVASLEAAKRPSAYPANYQLEAEHIAPFGIGDLPALSTATYYEHGRQRYAIPMERRTIALDFTCQKQFQMRDSFGGMHPLRIFDIAGRDRWNSVYPCSVTAVESGGDPFGVLFPAMEILRFAYGSSSAMLQAVTDGTLEQVLEATRLSARMEDGTFVIELPPRFQPEDAMTLAWLLHDDHARDSALHVHPSIAASVDAYGRSYPQPRLPYTGMRSAKVKGRMVTGSDGKQRFLVHHILGIELRLDVQVGLAMAGEGAEGSATGEAQHAGRRLPDADARRSTLDSSTAPGQGTASARLPALPSQFSNVRPVRVARATTSGPAAAAPGAAVHSPPTPRGTFSTDPGHQPGSRAQRGTASVATPARAAPVPADFTEIREVVRLLAREGYRTTERGPGTFPGSADPVLIIELEKGGQHRYLVERERRGGRSSGPLIVATLPQRRKASDAELARLLTLRTPKRVWLTFDTDGPWQLARVNHAYTSHRSFRDAILQRFHA